MSRDVENTIRLFGANNLLVGAALKKVERELGITLRDEQTVNPDKDASYYPQFPEDIRREAESMAKHYEIFYCLETSMRQIIGERLREEAGADWWEQKVPERVRRNAEGNTEREGRAGVTPRSSDMLACSNVGALGVSLKAHCDLFSDMFKDIAAVESIVARLNTLRAPIAHCCPLAEDEVLRLQLSLRDWFRQMG